MFSLFTFTAAFSLLFAFLSFCSVINCRVAIKWNSSFSASLARQGALANKSRGFSFHFPRRWFRLDFLGAIRLTWSTRKVGQREYFDTTRHQSAPILHVFHLEKRHKESRNFVCSSPPANGFLRSFRLFVRCVCKINLHDVITHFDELNRELSAKRKSSRRRPRKENRAGEIPLCSFVHDAGQWKAIAWMKKNGNKSYSTSTCSAIRVNERGPLALPFWSFLRSLFCVLCMRPFRVECFASEKSRSNNKRASAEWNKIQSASPVSASGKCFCFPSPSSSEGGRFGEAEKIEFLCKHD